MPRRRGRTLKRDQGQVLATLSTKAILDLHDRLIGCLEGPARERFLQAARDRGWDRTWDDGPVAV